MGEADGEDWDLAAAEARELRDLVGADRGVTLAAQIVRTTGAGLLLVDDRGVIRWANAAATTMLGEGRSLQGVSVDDLVEGVSPIGHADLRRGFMAEGSVRAMSGNQVLPARSVGGRPLYLRVGLALTSSDSVLAMVHDVTAEHRAQQALADSEHQYRHLTETAIEGIFRIRLVPERQFEYVNPAFVNLTGFALDDLRDDPLLLRKRTHPEDVVTDVEVTSARIRFQRADGQWRWLELWQSALRDEHGAMTEIQGLVLDVTNIRLHNERLEAALRREQAAREQLVELSELKDGFLRAASHELRTPVAAAFGLAQTLRARADLLTEEQVQDMHRRLERQLKRLSGLLEDLLDLNRLTSGNAAQIRRQRIDLAELVADVAADVDVGHRVVRLDLHPTPADVEPARVERIVYNLLANAVKHTPTGTSIWLGTQPGASGSAVLLYADDGPGIDEQQKAKIMAPFTQGPHAASAPNPGVGVGMSIIDQFARLHGGHIELGDRDGGGLTIRVVLPSVGPETTPLRVEPRPIEPGPPPEPQGEQIASKRALRAVSRSIESLAMSLATQGEPVLLVGLFEDAAYFAARHRTYADLADLADVVIGYVTGTAHPDFSTITLPDDSPLADEWAVLLISPRTCAALTARDLHDIGPGRTLEDARLFRTRLTTSRTEVNDQLRRILSVSSEAAPAAAREMIHAGLNQLAATTEQADAHVSDKLQQTWAGLLARTKIVQDNEHVIMSDPLSGAYTMAHLNSYLELATPRRELGPRSPSLAVVAFAVTQPPSRRAIDETAQVFADTVRRHSRRGDLLVRESHESWLLVLPAASAEEAHGVTRGIMASIAEQRPTDANAVIHVSAAIAVYEPTGIDLTPLRQARDRLATAPGTIEQLAAAEAPAS